VLDEVAGSLAKAAFGMFQTTAAVRGASSLVTTSAWHRRRSAPSLFTKKDPTDPASEFVVSLTP
jgi:hypothetical protein